MEPDAPAPNPPSQAAAEGTLDIRSIARLFFERDELFAALVELGYRESRP
jgi:hypothetical protein